MKVKGLVISSVTIVLILIILVITSSINKICNKSAEYKKSTSGENYHSIISNDNDLTFAVLGDIHQDTDKLEVAVKDLYGINPKIDALILNGDTVDQGVKEEYDNLKNFINDNRVFLPKKLIKNIGNHEFYNYKINVNSKADVQEFINRYLEFSEEDKVYHDTWVNNYHFISLGSEDGNSETTDSEMAFISYEQQEWLKEKLSDKYVKNKPILVFLHQPLNYANKHLLLDEQNRNINDILSKYPEVILFVSHTHEDLNASSILQEKPFTIIETGAIYYTIIPDKDRAIGVRLEPYIKGLFIEVMGNKVIIKARDFKEKKWIFIKEINK